MSRLVARTVHCSLIAFMLTGCAGLHLYSDTRDKQGQAAVKAWSEVDLKGFFAAERENRAKVLGQELTTSARRIASDRDLEIVELAKARVNALPARYDEQLTRLVGESGSDASAGLRSASRALAHIATLKAQNERNQSFLTQAGVPTLTCDDVTDPSKGPLSVWLADHASLADQVKRRIGTMVKVCDAIAKEQADYETAIKSIPGGSLRAKIRELENARNELRERRNALAAQQGRYAAALAAYKAELALKEQGKSTVERVADAADKVGEALKAIDAVQGFLEVEFIAQERIKRLSDLIASVKAGKEPADDASKGEIAALLLPQIADDIRAVSSASAGAHVVALLIQRDIERARADAAKVEVATVESAIALRQSAVESALNEALLIIRAHEAFRRPGAEKPELDLAKVSGPFHIAWNDLQPEQKLALLESTGQYLDSYGRQRAATERLDRMRTALTQQKASSLSEINAGMWSSLIDATVHQAADYATTGFKASDFERILAVLGILWIGHGTN